MSQVAARVAELLDEIPSHQRLVRAMLSIMKRRALTADDLPLSHSFHVKTVLSTVVIVTSRIVLLAIHEAIAVVAVRVGEVVTTLAGKSKNTSRCKRYHERGPLAMPEAPIFRKWPLFTTLCTGNQECDGALYHSTRFLLYGI